MCEILGEDSSAIAMSFDEQSDRGEAASDLRSTVADSHHTVADGEGDEAHAATLARGSAIGRYVVIERVGTGAMGIVYSAYDPELDRRLALKVLKVRGSSPRRRAIAHTRMVREAQALAKLSHPNVVAIHDVGKFEGGVFVVMDFVDGVTLDRWVEKRVTASGRPRDASWKDILAVFVQAGRGLAAAHAAGLVHRDFKPTNVIVDGTDSARVLDFGLARATDPNQLPTTAEHEAASTSDSGTSVSHARSSVLDLPLDLDALDDSSSDDHEAAASLAPSPPSSTRASISGSTRRGALEQRVTRIGASVGTPAYMAPEQHLGEDAGPASDQFAFCVALYEALYGTSPFPGDSPAAKAMAVTTGELRIPPRTRVPNRVREALVRGLAMRIDERHPDMATLVAELERAPRVRSWGWLAATTGGFVAIAAGAWAYGVHSGSQEICGGAEDRMAEVWGPPQHAAIRDAFAASSKAYASRSFDAVRSILDDYATQWGGDYVRTCEATHRHGVQSSALLDLRMACLERRRTELSATVELLTRVDEQVLENAVSAATALTPSAPCLDLTAEAGAKAPPSDPTALAQQQESLRELANTRALLRAGKYADASARAKQLVGRIEHGSDRDLLAEVLAVYGSALVEEGRYVEAKEALMEATRHAEFVENTRLLASLRNQLAVVAGERLGETQAGHVWVTLAATAIERLGGDLELEATRHAALAQIYDREGHHREELVETRAALETYERGEQPDAYHLAGFHNSLAAVLAQLGEHDEALGHARSALAGFEEVLGPAHPRTAIGHATLGLVYDYHGDYALALAEYERAAAILEAATGPTHGRMAEVLNNLAITRMNLGDEEEAIALFERVLTIKEANLPPGHLEIASALGNLGSAVRVSGRFDEALRYQERALQIRRAVLPDDHPDLGSSLASLANNLESLERYAEALPMREQALRILEKTFGTDSPSIVVDLANTAYTLLWNHRREDALRVAGRALAIVEHHDLQSDTAAFARIAYAEALLANHGDETRARTEVERALADLGELPATTERDLVRKLASSQGWTLNADLR